jgi:hypothetical protein
MNYELQSNTIVEQPASSTNEAVRLTTAIFFFLLVICYDAHLLWILIH